MSSLSFRGSESKYVIYAYATRDTSRGYDAETDADTLGEARRKARRFVSTEYRDLCECSYVMEYAKVQDAKTGECLFDIEAKPLAAMAKPARTLARVAYYGLYSIANGSSGRRWNDARASANGIELRDAYSEDRGDWVPLAATWQLTDSSGRPVSNPLASAKGVNA